jgi:hypothetical protein
MAKCVFFNIVFTAGLFILAFSVMRISDQEKRKRTYSVQLV